MNRKLHFFLMVLLALAMPQLQGQTFYSNDFSGELDESIWISQEGHSHSIQNGLLQVDIEKKDQNGNFKISFEGSPLNVEDNPVLNFKVRATQSISLSFYLSAGTFVIKEVYIPKSDEFVPISVEFDGGPSKFDYTQLKYIDVYVNKNAVSYNGNIQLDDFIIGDGAVKHANIGGIANPVVYSGEKNQRIVFKDITNAATVEVSGVDDYLENVEVSPILNSTFTDYVYLTFDVKEGVEGDGTMIVTAKGAGDFNDNSLEIPLKVVSNMPPTIDQSMDIEVETGDQSEVKLSGITDGDNNLDQKLQMSATSSNQAVISDDDIKIHYKQGSRYADLYFTTLQAGTAEITVTVTDEGESAVDSSIMFTVESWDNLNLPPTIDPVPDQLPYFDGNETTLLLTGISDGNWGTQDINFSLTSSDQAVIEDGSMFISDVNIAEGTALLHYTPVAEGSTEIWVKISDDAAGTDNGIKSDSISFLSKPVTLYPSGLDWNVVRDADRWGGDSGIEVEATSFDGSDVLKVTCTDKWIWGALNFSFSDTSVNLTEHPFVSLEIYSEDVETLHWLWFYDDYELSHEDAHRNDFPDVTHDEGKAVWVEPNTWTTVTFDFSGENEMSRKVGAEAIPINSKRIIRILYNYHNQENSWPRPPEFTGTFYIRNFNIGDKAEMPDPLATVDEVPDLVKFADPGPQTVTVSGLSDGNDGLPDVSVESMDPGFISPVISAVDVDGTAEISFDPGTAIGETEVVVTVSAENAQTVRDTFIVKTIEKSSDNASSVTIDLSKRFQTMHGFGTYMNEYFELYTREMGATAMRVGIIGNQIEPVNDNFDPNVLNREGLDYSAFNWEAMRKMKEMGVETFILTSWSAPNWMKDNHDESWYRGNVIPWEEARNRTSPIYYDEWAEYFVAAYRMFEEEAGIELAGIGIQNEPAFYEPYPSGILSPEEFAKIVAIVGKRFEREGIDCKLFMPEQVFSQPNYSVSEYIDAVHANPEADKYTDIIGVHGYASDGIGAGTPNFSAWTTMYNQAQEGSYPKELWMTETHKAYNSYDDALWIAMAIYGGLEYGNMSLWTQWGIVGQHIIDGNPTQMLYAVANYSRFIKPGAVRVESSSSNEDLFTTSWIDEKDGKFITVAINDSDMPITAYLMGDDIPGNFDQYLTTAIRKTEFMGNTGDSLFIIPPKGILTLVAEGNTAPSINPVEHQDVEVNASQQVINLTGISAVDEGQNIVSITAESDNTGLIANPVIGDLQPDGTATLTYQPVSGQSGMATISITVTDDGPDFVSNASSISFDIRVFSGINNPPQVAPVADVYLLEDTEGTQTIAVSVTDGDDGTQGMTGMVETDNPELFNDFSFNNNTMEIEYALTPEYFGEAVVKLTITDDGGTDTNNGDQSSVEEFTIFVASVNDAPLVSQKEEVSVAMNAAEQTITIEGIDMGDSFGASQSIAVSAETDNLALITPPIVEYASGSTADIKLTPIRNEIGTANITIYVLDDGGVMNGGIDLTTMTFSVEVIPTDINQAPTMDPIGDQVLYLSEGALTLQLEGVDDGDESKDQTLTVSAVSSKESVVSAPTVNWVPTMGVGSIKLTPVALGTSTITVTLKDNGGTDFGGVDSNEYSFTATVYQEVGVDTENTGINIYPNPAKDMLFISGGVNNQTRRISVTDISGKVLISRDFDHAKEVQEINISELDKGMYILVFENDKEDIRELFIKE